MEQTGGGQNPHWCWDEVLRSSCSSSLHQEWLQNLIQPGFNGRNWIFFSMPAPQQRAQLPKMKLQPCLPWFHFPAGSHCWHLAGMLGLESKKNGDVAPLLLFNLCEALHWFLGFYTKKMRFISQQHLETCESTSCWKWRLLGLLIKLSTLQKQNPLVVVTCSSWRSLTAVCPKSHGRVKHSSNCMIGC